MTTFLLRFHDDPQLRPRLDALRVRLRRDPKMRALGTTMSDLLRLLVYTGLEALERRDEE